MQVSVRSATISSIQRESIIEKINKIKSEIVDNIKVIANNFLIENPKIIISPEKVIAENFFIKHVTIDQLTKLHSLAQRVKDMTSIIVTIVGTEVMNSSLRGTFGMLSALTNQENLVSFFLVQTMNAVQKLTDDLSFVYSDEALDSFIVSAMSMSICPVSNPPPESSLEKPPIPEDEQECSICLSTILQKEAITTRCNHIFHKSCINGWLEKPIALNKCPNCRQVAF